MWLLIVQAVPPAVHHCGHHCEWRSTVCSSCCQCHGCSHMLCSCCSWLCESLLNRATWGDTAAARSPHVARHVCRSRGCCDRGISGLTVCWRAGCGSCCCSCRLCSCGPGTPLKPAATPLEHCPGSSLSTSCSQQDSPTHLTSPGTSLNRARVQSNTETTTANLNRPPADLNMLTRR